MVGRLLRRALWPLKACTHVLLKLLTDVGNIPSASDFIKGAIYGECVLALLAENPPLVLFDEGGRLCGLHGGWLRSRLWAASFLMLQWPGLQGCTTTWGVHSSACGLNVCLGFCCHAATHLLFRLAVCAVLTCRSCRGTEAAVMGTEVQGLKVTCCLLLMMMMLRYFVERVPLWHLLL